MPPALPLGALLPPAFAPPPSGPSASPVPQPPTLVFDYPTPTVLARHLRAEFSGQSAAAPV
ncbi:acyl carrier protein, partial [Streptomyces goshikiensis]|uniref:acyl carrier protein n=1 Tax=Streptomyces goshikiensis TaxID=1942 RepID=UPI0033B2544E